LSGEINIGEERAEYQVRGGFNIGSAIGPRDVAGERDGGQ